MPSPAHAVPAGAKIPTVPLEAGLGPDNPPCPADGEPLFGWAKVRPHGTPVRRCEACGLAVTGAPADRGEARAALLALGAGERFPNRAGLQAWIGGSGWAALGAHARFLFTPRSLRQLGFEDFRTRVAFVGMWQTMLNSFTFGHNVALSRLGRGEGFLAEKAWQRRMDIAISVLSTPLLAPIALLLELLAAAFRRPGGLELTSLSDRGD